MILAACGASKDANNSNFEKAVNTHLAKSCVVVMPGGFMDGHTYPVAIAMQVPNAFRSAQQASQQNAQATRSYDALVKAGLLSVREGTTKEPQLFGNGPKDVPAKIYDLTDAGKKALADPGGKDKSLCAGHYKVDEVVRFTEPANAMGSTISEVSYTFSAVDVPDWAKSADVQQVFTDLGPRLADHQKGRTTLVLASDGWIDANDFNR
ncbi:hypothetical protein [Paraburkholderia tropica]|uniref:hypothetical protein n=1 Tax=Paraburkholderia tropica TaxID=92647 RepID=UPI0012E9D440|nr:hypothetical protein [Paraburkholderia tropica]